MNKYEAIYESLQDKLDRAIITPEIAERLNDLAYEKYVVNESKKDDDLAMIDSLREKIDSGDVKLSKDVIEEIQELIGTEEADDDGDAKEDTSDKKDEGKSEEPEAEEAEGEGEEEVKEESVEEVLTEGFDVKAALKNMKRKIQMLKVSKENKAQVVDILKAYNEELNKMQQAYKEAEEMLAAKFDARRQKIDAKYDAKINKLMDK